MKWLIESIKRAFFKSFILPNVSEELKAKADSLRINFSDIDKAINRKEIKGYAEQVANGTPIDVLNLSPSQRAEVSEMVYQKVVPKTPKTQLDLVREEVLRIKTLRLPKAVERHLDKAASLGRRNCRFVKKISAGRIDTFVEEISGEFCFYPFESRDILYCLNSKGFDARMLYMNHPVTNSIIGVINVSW